MSVQKNNSFYNVGIAAIALTLAVGCASQKSAVTGLDRASENQKSLVEMDGKINKAQKELTSFQQSLKELQSSMATTKDGYSTEQANRVLARLALRVDQTQLDFRELKAQNDDAKKDLDTRLNQAAEANQRLIRQGN